MHPRCENLLTTKHKAQQDEMNGIEQSKEVLISPNFKHNNKKRGRKSFNELKAMDAEVEGQAKRIDLFHAGKGKVLPKAQ